MNKCFSFIHCADLHLGAEPLKIKERFNDFFNSFGVIVDYAINNKINNIIISGDLFHLKNINSKTLINTTAILEKAKENSIKIYVIEGNHDKAFYVDEDSWLEFLKEKGYVNLLKHNIEDGKIVNVDVVEEKDVRIFGVGYLGTSTNLHLKDIKECIEKNSKEKKFNILLLHAAIDKLAGMDLAGVKQEEIEILKDDVDYLALGHIHYEYNKDEWIYNPGSIEKLRFEEGNNQSKGFYVVDVYKDNNIYKKEVKYIPLEARIVKTIKLDISKCSNDVEAKDYILNYNYAMKSGDVICLKLTGVASWNSMLISYKEISENLIEKYNLLYLEINNMINILKESNDEVEYDFEEVERKEIKAEVIKRYPNLNADKLVENILFIKDAIINGEDKEEILNKIYKDEVYHAN